MSTIIRYMILLFISSADLQAYISPGYLGCFDDSFEIRILRGTFQKLIRNSGKNCKEYCKLAGYRYAGTKDGFGCYCGNTIRKERRLVSGCYERCPGRIDEICGGITQISLHDTWSCATKPCERGYTCEDIDADTYTCFCTSNCGKVQSTTRQTTEIRRTQKMGIETRTVIPTSKVSTVNSDGQLSTDLFNTSRDIPEIGTTQIVNVDVTVIHEEANTEQSTNNSAIIILPVLLVIVVTIITVISIIVVKKRRQNKDEDVHHEYHEPAEPISNINLEPTYSFVKQNSSHIVNSEALQLDETYLEYVNSNVDSHTIDGPYEMLQHEATSNSEYTTIDVHRARIGREANKDINYEALNKERQPDELYSEIDTHHM